MMKNYNVKIQSSSGTFQNIKIEAKSEKEATLKARKLGFVISIFWSV